jgi:exodeoxyribonuclease-5
MRILYTTGYAGTGKSTKLLMLINKELDPTTSVVLAPTHKALARLRPAVTSAIELSTIHALLGWIPSINEDAQHINHIDTVIKLEKDIDSYTDIVIDEAGMMSEEMLMSIVGKLEELNDFETDHITLHLFLDPYQLLPVKGIQIQTDPATTTNLTVQHRAESPDVVKLFTKFVNYLEGSNVDDLTTPESDNVLYAENLDGFLEGDRLLAYTNKAVGDYNKQIAGKLGIDSFVGQEVQLGSQPDLYKVDSFVEPSLRELLTWYETGTLKLQNSQINRKFLVSNLEAIQTNKHIKFISSEGKIIPVIIGIGTAYEVRRKAKEAAIKDKKKFREVYAIGRAFTMDYSFASTVHKAQGSEFNRVWIDKKDIQKSIFGGNYRNYARLMYVAISRAKRKVFVL